MYGPQVTETSAVYDSLARSTEDGRWAFGTGFEDARGDRHAGAGRRRRAGLAAYCLMLGDDALICAQRLPQWMTRCRSWKRRSRWPTSRWTCSARRACCSPGPARPKAPCSRGTAATKTSSPSSAPSPSSATCGWPSTATPTSPSWPARLLVFSTWRLALFGRLAASKDPVLAAIAAKGVKELAYHRDYAAAWVVRLGDGTDVSHARMQAALDAVWPLRRGVVPRRPGRAGDCPAWRPTRRRSAPRWTPCSTGARRGHAGPPEAAPLGRVAAGPGATACTPKRWATCSPSCRASPARTRTRHGDAAGPGSRQRRRRARSPRPSPTRSCPWSPWPTWASCATWARRATRWSRSPRPTRAAPRCARSRHDLRRRLAAAGFGGSRCAQCWRPPGAPTGSPRAAGEARRGRHRPAGPARRRPARAGPADPHREPARGSPARDAARRTRRRLRRSAPPPARRCAAAALPRAVRAREGDLMSQAPRTDFHSLHGGAGSSG